MAVPVLTGATESARVSPIESITSFVNVRDQPDRDSPVIGALHRGETVRLVKELSRWYEIELPEGTRGFVHRHWTRTSGDAIKLESSLQSPTDSGKNIESPLPATAGNPARVVAAKSVTSFVNIRAQPSLTSAVIGNLAVGESVPLLGEQPGWYLVELPGSEGYVSQRWTERTAGQIPKKSTQPAVAAGAKPGRDRTVLAKPAELLKQGRSQDAYQLLSQLELSWAGDSGFDYLLGIAALDSGHPGEAIFALERVVKLLPKFTGARMELARALFNVGDHDLAEKEFVKLLEKKPPEEVRNIIMAFLEIIRNPPVTENPPQRVIYAMASGGYDSNANGAADINEFLGFTLDPRSKETDSPFAEAALGGVIKRPLKPGLDLIALVDARHRHNRDADYVDNTYASGTVSLAFRKGDNEYSTGLATTWSAIDGSFNERGLALDFSWTRPLQNEKALRATMRMGPVRYTDALKARDLDRLNYAMTIRRPIQDGASNFDWTLIGGRDIARDRATPYSNSRAGARIGGTWQVKGRNLFWGLGALRIPYNGTDFFGTDREDKQFTVNVGIEIVDKPLKGWVFVPNASFVKNKSNVSIYDNDRIQIGVQFRAVR